MTYPNLIKARWLALSEAKLTGHATKSTKKDKAHKLLRIISDDEDDALDIGLDIPDDPQCLCLQEYQAYVNVADQVPDGWTAVKWWGVSVFKIGLPW